MQNLEEEAQWKKTRALMEVGYLPFYIWTSSLEDGIYFLISFIFYFFFSIFWFAVLQVVHREADIVLNLNMYSQENCVGKFCRLFLKIKMSLEKLKWVGFSITKREDYSYYGDEIISFSLTTTNSVW